MTNPFMEFMSDEKEVVGEAPFIVVGIDYGTTLVAPKISILTFLTVL
jgi:hypothetical protein